MEVKWAPGVLGTHLIESWKIMMKKIIVGNAFDNVVRKNIGYFLQTVDARAGTVTTAKPQGHRHTSPWQSRLQSHDWHALQDSSKCHLTKWRLHQNVFYNFIILFVTWIRTLIIQSRWWVGMSAAKGQRVLPVIMGVVLYKQHPLRNGIKIRWQRSLKFSTIK